MRLLKTHSHTSERRGYEADKECQVKREWKEAYPKGTEKNAKKGKPPPYHLEGGERAKTCRRKSENPK